MKKVFFAMAVAGMFGLTACNNANKAAEETVDSAKQAVEAAACDATETAADATENLAEELVDAASEAVQELIAEEPTHIHPSRGATQQGTAPRLFFRTFCTIKPMPLRYPPHETLTHHPPPHPGPPPSGRMPGLRLVQQQPADVQTQTQHRLRLLAWTPLPPTVTTPS